MNGTTCDSGKLCLNGQCVSNPQAPNGTCLFGDDLVSSGTIGNALTLPSPLMNCSAVIQLMSSNELDPVLFCQSSQVLFGKACCNTCAGTCF